MYFHLFKPLRWQNIADISPGSNKMVMLGSTPIENHSELNISFLDWDMINVVLR